MLAPKRKTTVLLLLLLILGVLVIHQWKLWGWQVDDAAISFTYARNWAQGHGLVAFVGQERAEGFSNPLWVGLLALWELIGVHGFVSAKVMGLVFSGLAVLFTWRAAAIDRPPSSFLPLVAAVVVAMSCSLGIWSASGLETPLFAALLSGAIWRVLAEARGGGRPWSALLCFGLAITRPEGILYAAILGLWALVLEASNHRRWRRIGGWLLFFFVPFAAYHAARYSYFAYPFPSTYYAKMGGEGPDLLRLTRRGWKQLGDYSTRVLRIELLPLYLLGLLGLRGWRAVVWLAACVGLAALHFSGHIGPRWSAWVLVGVAGLVPLLALGGRRWSLRVLSWLLVMAGIFFSIRADGDWMKGYRWMGQIAVPLSLLLAEGLTSIIERVRWKPVGAVIVVAILGWHAWAQYSFTWHYKPPPSPKDVKIRLHLFRDLADVLHMEPERLTVVDHDLGGLMWWGGYFGWIYDSVGLVNLPIAVNKHQKWRRLFFDEYLLDQGFDFTHLHGKTRRALKGRPAFKRHYVEVMGYPPPRRKHKANFARRALFLRKDIAPTGAAVRYENGLEILKLNAWPQTRPGGYLFVEIAARCSPCSEALRSEPESLEVEVTLTSDSYAAEFPVTLGYGWVGLADWKKGEVFDGRFSVQMPEDMPHGRYRASLRLRQSEGPWLPALDGGEDNWQGEVELVTGSAVRNRSSKLADRAITLANQDRCEPAIDTWDRGRLFQPRNGKWRRKNRKKVGPPISACLLREARQAPDPATETQLIRRARKWHPASEPLAQFAETRGEHFHAEGLAARAEEDWDRAFDLFTKAVRADPSRAWSRRYAEEARAERLGNR